MALLCCIKAGGSACECMFYTFPERPVILNHLTSTTVQVVQDGIVVARNGLITKYDLSSDEVTFVTKLLCSEFNSYRVFPPARIPTTTFDVIYLV